MTLDLEAIPEHDDEVNPSQDATGSLKLLGSSMRRRSVLRSIGLGGATAGALVLGWSPLSQGQVAHAETSPTGLTGWDANDCKDAYPRGYNEQQDTEGDFVGQPGACYGGRVMGSTMCDATGWHRSDTVGNWRSGTSYRPVSTSCGATSTKNAWRWTVAGVTYRCSDGMTTVSNGWQRYSYLSICRAQVS